MGLQNATNGLKRIGNMGVKLLEKFKENPILLIGATAAIAGGGYLLTKGSKSSTVTDNAEEASYDSVEGYGESTGGVGTSDNDLISFVNDALAAQTEYINQSVGGLTDKVNNQNLYIGNTVAAFNDYQSQLSSTLNTTTEEINNTLDLIQKDVALNKTYVEQQPQQEVVTAPTLSKSISTLNDTMSTDTKVEVKPKSTTTKATTVAKVEEKPKATTVAKVEEKKAETKITQTQKTALQNSSKAQADVRAAAEKKAAAQAAAKAEADKKAKAQALQESAKKQADAKAAADKKAAEAAAKAADAEAKKKAEKAAATATGKATAQSYANQYR